jgi:hypothetical protein
MILHIERSKILCMIQTKISIKVQIICPLPAVKVTILDTESLLTLKSKDWEQPVAVLQK